METLRRFSYVVFAMSILLAIYNAAEAGFIPAPDRVDMVYDSPRETLYITSGSSILRYNTASNSFSSPIYLPTSILSGIDISPDGNRLLVADKNYSTNTLWVHEVDLSTGLTQKIMFPRAFGEGGTFAAAYGSDGSALITSDFLGSGWVPLRQYNSKTGTTTELASVTQRTMVSASADDNIIGFAESNISSGSIGRFRVSDGNLLRLIHGTDAFNFEAAVNRNGTQIAIPTYDGTFISDGDLNGITKLGTSAGGGVPIGVVYSPSGDVIYVAWSGTTTVLAFNTNTFYPMGSIDFGNYFDWPGNRAFVEGRLKMSDDGSLLFATVDGGIGYEPIPEFSSLLLFGIGLVNILLFEKIGVRSKRVRDERDT